MVPYQYTRGSIKKNKKAVEQRYSHENLKPHEKLIPWYTSGFQ